MLRLCHSRAPASEGTSKLERSTALECIWKQARIEHGALGASTARELWRRRAGCDEPLLAHDPNPKARRPRI